VVLQGSAPPTIVRTERVWRRGDYRAWRRSGGALALPAPAQAKTAEPSPSLLAPAGRPQWPGDGLAARRDRAQPRPAEPPPAASGDDGQAAMPPGPARPPQPPARPAPWLRPGEEDGDR
jgi:hypothetical protein